MGGYISQDPIGLFGDNPNIYMYVKDTNRWIDEFGLYSDLNHTGDGHHLFPRSVGTKLGIRDQIEGIKWYPNDSIGTADLHKDLHRNLIDEGVPFHGSKFGGTMDEALDAMDRAYKDFDTEGFLMIDGKRYDNLTPSQAMDKVRNHLENKKNSKQKIKNKH